MIGKAAYNAVLLRGGASGAVTRPKVFLTYAL